MSYLVFWNGTWVNYKPLEGYDPSFTDSTLQLGAAVYAQSLSKGALRAHCDAEVAMFESQRSLGNIIRPRVAKKNRTT